MNLALQKRHEQLERWRQYEELAELEQQQLQQAQQASDVGQGSNAPRLNQAVQQQQQQLSNSNRTTRSSNKSSNISAAAYDKSSQFDDTSTGNGGARKHKRYSSSQDGSRVKFNQSTLFLNACANGDLDECKRMLANKFVDINVTTCDGLTGLHEAAICGNAELLEYLIEQGANVDCCDNEGWTPLHAAASLGQSKIVELLLKHKASVTIVNCENFLAYDLARNDEVRQLLANQMKEYDIDQLRRQEELMIEQDIERWIKTGHYEERSHPTTQATVLHVLAAKGYVKLMKRLLEAPQLKRQLNLEARDNEGYTPLLAASFWQQAEIVELLIEHGADIFAQANNGYKISSIHLKNYQDSKLQSTQAQQQTQPQAQQQTQQQPQKQTQTPRPTIARAPRSGASSIGSLDSADSANVSQQSVDQLAGDKSLPSAPESLADSAELESESIGDSIPSASARHLRSSQHGQLSKSKSLELGANKSQADSPLLHGSMSVDRLLLRADSMGEKDLRKSFKELVIENERLREQLRGFDDKEKQRQQDWIRKERQLHRKISELEEENKQLEHWRQEIQRLKDENNSLIRVVSKLTKQHH